VVTLRVRDHRSRFLRQLPNVGRGNLPRTRQIESLGQFLCSRLIGLGSEERVVALLVGVSDQDEPKDRLHPASRPPHSLVLTAFRDLAHQPFDVVGIPQELLLEGEHREFGKRHDAV